MATKIFSFKMSSADGIFYNKVRAVKGLRKLTLLGLKEAKELAESIKYGFPNVTTTSLEVNPDPVAVADAIVNIEEGGITIVDNSGPDRIELLDGVKVLCADAVNKGQYDIAQTLLDLLIANK